VFVSSDLAAYTADGKNNRAINLIFGQTTVKFRQLPPFSSQD
jgi:hypothetical protein